MNISNHPIVRVPPPGRGVLVDTDVPCRKCSYNLRGLSTSGLCPECAAPVALSTGGDLLRYTDPDWLQTLRWGIRLILIGIGVAIVTIVADTVMVVTATGRGGEPDAIVTTIMMVASNVLMTFGAWRLTTPDPSGIGEDVYGVPRRFARVGLLLGVGQQIVQLPVTLGTFRPEIALALTVIGQLVGFLSMVGFLAELHYLQHLARRIPDPALAGRARLLKRGFGLCFGGFVVYELVLVASLGPSALVGGPMINVNSTGPLLAAGCAIGAAAVALLVFGIMHAALLVRLRRRLGEQLRIARSTRSGAASAV